MEVLCTIVAEFRLLVTERKIAKYNRIELKPVSCSMEVIQNICLVQISHIQNFCVCCVVGPVFDSTSVT